MIIQKRLSSQNAFICFAATVSRGTWSSGIASVLLAGFHLVKVMFETFTFSKMPSYGRGRSYPPFPSCTVKKGVTSDIHFLGPICIRCQIRWNLKECMHSLQGLVHVACEVVMSISFFSFFLLLGNLVDLSKLYKSDNINLLWWLLF